MAQTPVPCWHDALTGTDPQHGPAADPTDPAAVRPELVSTGETGLSGRSLADAERPAGLQLGEIQRRQLSILFADLADSTGITSRYDVEEVRELLLGFLEASAARIEAAHGFLARFMGDGLLAYFGYPVAHDEAARLAAHAALEIQKVVGELRLPDGTPVRARIGIATGEVMIGDIIGRGLASECMVIGEAANLAARLQTAAPPGTSLICATTRGLLGETFALEPVEPLALKGFSRQIAAWKVLGAGTADRFASRVGLGLAPLVGREAELQRLTADLARVDQGLQRVVIVSEPGMGKSRLLHALREHAEDADLRWIATSGAATSTQTPYFGLRLLIESLLVPQPALPGNRRARRWAAAMRALGFGGQAGALAAAIGLAATDQGSASDASLAADSGRLPLLCARYLERVCRDRPVVIAIEDGHWLDGSSRKVLSDVLPLIAGLPVLIVLTSRPGSAVPFPDWPQLSLPPLDRAALAEVVRHCVGEDLDSAALDAILRRAQGVALFAEELGRMLAAGQGTANGPIPHSLADLLLSRVDRGKDGLAVAQAIAVLGEDAVPAVIAEVTGRDQGAVKRAIDALTANAVLIAGASGDGPLAFRHALFGESAYAALPGRQRRTLHGAAARRLIEAGAAPSRIAQHFDRSGEAALALDWWLRAAHLARRRRALPEARSAYERAMHLAAERAPSQSLLAVDALALHSHYFEVLQLSLGYSAPETVAAGQTLRTLVEKQGDLQQQLTAVTGEWAAASSAGEYDLANRHAERAPVIARALGTSDALAAAAMIQLTARYRCGDLMGAEEAFAAGQPHFEDPQFDRRSGAIAQTFGNAALNAWLIGDDAAAQARIAVLADWESRHTDPYSHAFSRHMASMALLALGELKAAEAAARAALAIAGEAGFPQYQAIARITLGAALCGQEAREEGLALMHEGLQRMEATRSKAAITLYHIWLGEAELAAGRVEQALGTVQRGLLVCPQERYVVPELLRLRAIMEAATGRPALAEQLLDEARAKAMAMGARGLLRKLAQTILPGRDESPPSRRSA